MNEQDDFINEQDDLIDEDDLLYCPQCNKDDRISKVSAIHRDGISTTTGTGWTRVNTTNGSQLKPVTVTGTQQTTLSRLCEPPTIKSAPGTGEGGFQFILFFLAVAVFVNIFDQQNQLLMLATVGIYVLLAILIHNVFSKARQRRKRLEVKLARQVKEKLKLWESFYYCYRCDGVFLPGEETIVPPERIEELYPPDEELALH